MLTEQRGKYAGEVWWGWQTVTQLEPVSSMADYSPRGPGHTRSPAREFPRTSQLASWGLRETEVWSLPISGP